MITLKIQFIQIFTSYNCAPPNQCIIICPSDSTQLSDNLCQCNSGLYQYFYVSNTCIIDYVEVSTVCISGALIITFGIIFAFILIIGLKLWKSYQNAIPLFLSASVAGSIIFCASVIFQYCTVFMAVSFQFLGVIINQCAIWVQISMLQLSFSGLNFVVLPFKKYFNPEWTPNYWRNALILIGTTFVVLSVAADIFFHLGSPYGGHSHWQAFAWAYEYILFVLYSLTYVLTICQVVTAFKFYKQAKKRIGTRLAMMQIWVSVAGATAGATNFSLAIAQYIDFALDIDRRAEVYQMALLEAQNFVQLACSLVEAVIALFIAREIGKAVMQLQEPEVESYIGQ